MGLFHWMFMALFYAKVTGQIDITWLQVTTPLMFVFAVGLYRGIVYQRQERMNQEKGANNGR